MGREEQREEREVLESIFPDEINYISDTEFRISVTLDLPPDADAPDDDEDEGEAPIIILTVRYPDDYPEAAPDLDLSPPPNAPPHKYFNVAADKDALLQSLESTVEENMGMAMVFSIVSALKENAEQMIIDRRAEVAKKREEEALAAEREENKKFHGTPVTRETFLKWRDEFFREMQEAKEREEEERLAELKKAKGPKEAPKLTGRQLWERGLVGKVVEEDEDDEPMDKTAAGVEALKV
ncbi:hypothetical protein DL546_004230 [Coniochaeta pulveracea]|uniref:RWD domain-containing protein n=1 Tax=Coniochaeta pulveracea TaxID=177199 RepID=A0A420Y4J2_9PEZI|nr:hypothetical protein DL546_004230 [Coniochaeta pulveracea]